MSAGKGDSPRPCQTGREERDLRHALAFGLITKEMFEARYEELVQKHKIIRSGRVIHAGDR
jgi:hypothetical protein